MDRTYEVEIDPETEITVCSGEIGCDGHCEIYRRKRTVKALKRRIKKEQDHGDRWCKIWFKDEDFGPADETRNILKHWTD